ncbi:hypothetical protein BX666DRAFT_1971191 [Dichotomocladium elegans]|nr:hypothetical protein BX666DRAFT_1971191 [Dichotomocladium elegans]
MWGVGARCPLLLVFSSLRGCYIHRENPFSCSVSYQQTRSAFLGLLLHPLGFSFFGACSIHVLRCCPHSLSIIDLHGRQTIQTCFRVALSCTFSLTHTLSLLCVCTERSPLCLIPTNPPKKSTLYLCIFFICYLLFSDEKEKKITHEWRLEKKKKVVVLSERVECVLCACITIYAPKCLLIRDKRSCAFLFRQNAHQHASCVYVYM